MEALLARYLDGELTEEQAAELLERAENDPRWARALAAYEAMLVAARQLPSSAPSGGFTGRVMEHISRAAAVQSSQAGARRQSPEGGRVQGPALRHHRRVGWTTARSLLVPGAGWVPRIAAAGIAVAVFAAGILAGRSARGPALLSELARREGGGAVTQTVSAAGRTLLGGTPWITAAAGSDRRVVRLVYVPQRGDVGGVTIAGSFNSWDPDALPMQRAGGVFTAMLSLPPGAYEYMFVEDGQRWVTDPLALQTRDDGFGNANAVLDLTL